MSAAFTCSPLLNNLRSADYMALNFVVGLLAYDSEVKDTHPEDCSSGPAPPDCLSV